MALETEPDTPVHHAKNYFLFSYYCRGINFSDIAFLKWQNIEGERMNYVRKKTGEGFNMKLVAPAQAIIDYYKQEFFQTRDGYVFPILFDRHKTATSIDNRIDKMLKVVNKALKEIGAKCEISTPLTTYVARHSFATNMKRNGVSVSVISEALGHDSEKTTKIYLDSFENDALDSAVEMLVAKHTMRER